MYRIPSRFIVLILFALGISVQAQYHPDEMKTSELSAELMTIAEDTWAYLSSNWARTNHLPWSYRSDDAVLSGGDFANTTEIGLLLTSWLAAYDMQQNWSPSWNETETEVMAILNQLRAWQTGSQTSKPHGENAYNNSVFYQWYWISWDPPVVGEGDANHVVPSIDNAFLAASLITTREYASQHNHIQMHTVADAILSDMDFRLWYDEQTGLFSWGGPDDPQDPFMADIYSNENRLINFIAHTQGDISDQELLASLAALDQTSTIYQSANSGAITIDKVSWDNSYFTYLAPALFYYETNTLYATDTLNPATAAQIAYAEDQGYTVWGLSDAYGVGTDDYLHQGALPLHPSNNDAPEAETGVVTPHAGAMALLTDYRSSATSNLLAMKQLFPDSYATGYGFRDSILVDPNDPDYGTPSARYSSIAQGWLFLSMVNAHSGFVWEYFYRSPQVRETHQLVWQNRDRIKNGDFADTLQEWSFWGDMSKSWDSDALVWHRSGWKTPVMFQIIDEYLPADTVLEAAVDLTNNSAVPKTVALNVRNTDYSQQMICAVTLNPGQSRTITLRDTTTSDWPRIHYTVRTFDRDNLPSITVDNALLRVRNDLTLSEAICSGSDALISTNYLLNGDFSYTGWRYWARWGDIVGNIANEQLSLYRPANAGVGVVFTRVYQYFVPDTHLELSLDVTNNSGNTKDINALLREETWVQHTNCNFDINAGSTHRVTVRLTTNTTWSNAVVSLRPLQGDGLPLVVDNVSLRAVASSGANCSNTVIGSSTLALNAISPSPHISGEVTQFTLSGAPDGTTIALDCDADGVFESDGLACPVMSENVTAQISTADGTVFGTTALNLEVMSVEETLAYLETEFGLTGLDAIDLSDPQTAFDALFAMSQQTDDPVLAALLNRLTYTIQR